MSSEDNMDDTRQPSWGELALAFRRRLAHLRPLADGCQPTRDGIVATLTEETPDDPLC